MATNKTNTNYSNRNYSGKWPKILPIQKSSVYFEVSSCDFCRSICGKAGLEYCADAEDITFLSTLHCDLAQDVLLFRFENIISWLEFESSCPVKGRAAHSCLHRLLFKQITRYWKEKRARVGPLARKYQLNPLLISWKPV